MSDPNHYKVLGVSRNATTAEIKTAYSKLVLTAHPDKGGSQENFIVIQAAWEVLRDTDARARFDQRNPRATGVPGKPQQPQGKPAQSTVFPKPYPSKAGPAPEANEWTEFRESSGGNAYNNYHGFADYTSSDRGRQKSPPRKSKPGNRSHHQTRPNQTGAPEPEDTPMSDDPHPGQPEQPRESRSRSHGRKARSHWRQNGQDDGRYRMSQSPPEPSAEDNDGTLGLLSVQAQEAKIVFKNIMYNYDGSHEPTLRTEDENDEVNIKLEHIHCHLENCDLKLKQRLRIVEQYHADLLAGRNPAPLYSFPLDDAAKHLNENDTSVEDLYGIIMRLACDTKEMRRMKTLFKAQGRQFPEDHHTVVTAKSSAAALDRLLKRILTDKTKATLPGEPDN